MKKTSFHMFETRLDQLEGPAVALTVTEASLQSWGGLMKTKKVKGRTDEGTLPSAPAAETRKCSRIILTLVLVEQITGLDIFSYTEPVVF